MITKFQPWIPECQRQSYRRGRTATSCGPSSGDGSNAKPKGNPSSSTHKTERGSLATLNQTPPSSRNRSKTLSSQPSPPRRPAKSNNTCTFADVTNNGAFSESIVKYCFVFGTLCGVVTWCECLPKDSESRKATSTITETIGLGLFRHRFRQTSLDNDKNRQNMSKNVASRLCKFRSAVKYYQQTVCGNVQHYKI